MSWQLRQFFARLAERKTAIAANEWQTLILYHDLWWILFLPCPYLQQGWSTGKKKPSSGENNACRQSAILTLVTSLDCTGVHVTAQVFTHLKKTLMRTKIVRAVKDHLMSTDYQEYIRQWYSSKSCSNESRKCKLLSFLIVIRLFTFRADQLITSLYMRVL